MDNSIKHHKRTFKTRINYSADVTWIKRCPRDHGNFSIERCFEAIERGLDDNNETSLSFDSFVVPCRTDGLLTIIKNCWAVSKIRTPIAHVTGDINYVLPFTRANHRIITIHDVGFITENDHPRIKRWILLFFWLKLPLRHCNTVVCVSQQTLDRLNLLVSPMAGQTRLVIPTAIPAKSIPQIGPSPFPPGKKIVLQVGTASNKNLTRVWEACENVDCHLAIVGHPTDELQQLQSASSLSHSIFTNVSDVELEQLYLNCDVVSFVSTHEGFGMPLIEAQIFGKPCITSNIEPMKSNAGGGALLVNPISVTEISAGIQRLISASEFVRELVRLGHQNARRFSGNAVARQHLRIYQDALL